MSYDNVIWDADKVSDLLSNIHVFETTFFESGHVVSASHGAKRINSLDDRHKEYAEIGFHAE